MTPYPMDPVDATGPMRLVVCPFPTETEAEAAADAILRARLAACVQLIPIRSRYWWKGTVERADETLVVCKTVPKRVGALFRWIAAHHSYDVPEIIELDVPRVHDAYLAYLAETIDLDAPPLPLGGGRAGATPTRRGSRRARGAGRPGRTQGPPRRR